MILNHIKDNINVAFLKKIITENHETIAKEPLNKHLILEQCFFWNTGFA